jgi:hypothetical protein
VYVYVADPFAVPTVDPAEKNSAPMLFGRNKSV